MALQDTEPDDIVAAARLDELAERYAAAPGRIKVNPLARWQRSRAVAEILRRGLRRRPLEAEGYLSVGCFTCTDRVRPGEALRAGRRRGLGKTERESTRRWCDQSRLRPPTGRSTAIPTQKAQRMGHGRD